MLHLHTFAGLTLFLGIAFGNPAPVGAALDRLASQQSFSLQEVGVERKRPWSAPHAIRNTYLKYGVEPPDYIEEAVRIADVNIKTYLQENADPKGKGSAPVETIQHDKEYLLKVQVGNHNLSLDLDTGSSDLYVLRSNHPHLRQS
jgi:aspergillopepsin I